MTVDEGVHHSGRLIGGESLAVGWKVSDTPDGTRTHGGWVEYHDVGKGTLSKFSTVGEREQVGLHLRELVDRRLEGQDLLVANPFAEEIGGGDGIAQLADVGAGIGEAKGGSVDLEQLFDTGLVVVGDHGLEAEL